MYNKLKKINLNHSFIFFFVINIICILSFKYSNLNISSLLCLFLILIIGVSHGSLDHIKGKKLLELFNIKSIYVFYIAYILISAAVITTWILLPSMTLILFLIIASYHFGKEDGFRSLSKVNQLQLKKIYYFSRGSIIIISPIIFHSNETIEIFKVISSDLFVNYLLFLKKYYFF